MEVEILNVITDKHTSQARNTLKVARIRATIRKGKGSCRYQMYVTPKDQADLDVAVKELEKAGFSLAFIGWGRAYMNWISK